MAKKLMTGLLALVALAALALPAVASASPELGETTSPGIFSRLAVGAKVTGVQLGVSKMTSPGNALLVECDTGHMTGELAESSASSFKIDIVTASFDNSGGGPCSTTFGGTAVVTTNVGNGTPWCLQSLSEDRYEVRGARCKEAARSITFVLDTTTAGVCRYNSTSFPRGTFTTDIVGNEQDAKLTLTKAGLWKKEEGGLLCPTEANLDMEFTLTTDESTTPLYIR